MGTTQAFVPFFLRVLSSAAVPCHDDLVTQHHWSLACYGLDAELVSRLLVQLRPRTVKC